MPNSRQINQHQTDIYLFIYLFIYLIDGGWLSGTKGSVPQGHCRLISPSSRQACVLSCLYYCRNADKGLMSAVIEASINGLARLSSELLHPPHWLYRYHTNERCPFLRFSRQVLTNLSGIFSWTWISNRHDPLLVLPGIYVVLKIVSFKLSRVLL
jgi:hypothetical protein